MEFESEGEYVVSMYGIKSVLKKNTIKGVQAIYTRVYIFFNEHQLRKVINHNTSIQ